MEVKASLKHIRMSAQKVRLVIDVVRGLTVEEAQNQLKFINKKASEPVAKLIKSAVANAENTFNLERSNLFISEIKADEGLTLKRWMPRAYGRATSIRKRGSHLSLVLKEIKETKNVKKKEVKIEDPVKLDQLSEGDKKGKDTKKKASEGKVDKTSAKSSQSSDKSAKMFRRKAG